MSRKILLIEDNPDHAELTKKILISSNDGYQVDYVDDAREGLNRIFQQDYDLVLSDYRMPSLSALDILGELKKRGKNLPLIIITSSGNEKVAVEAMKRGAYDYVVKDFSYEDTLSMVIRKAIERYNEITVRRKAEQELQESERKIRSILNAIPHGVLGLEEHHIIFANNAVENVFGWRPEELIGKSPRILYRNSEEYENIGKRFYSMLEKQQNYSEEFICRRKDNKEIICMISASRMDEGLDNKRIVAMYEDITERKRAEKQLEEAYRKLKDAQEQLIQSSKMAAMGQLAAGISHELNQPLTGIKGFIQAILMDIDKNTPIYEDLEKINRQAERMDKIIKNIRLYAQKARFKLEPININQPIEDSFMLLEQQLRLHNIKVEKHLAQDLPKIKGDANQLQQVFLNLITNARDAIDEMGRESGGIISVTTELDKNRYVVNVIFSDTGCGIKEEDLGNIFNPFYTSKSPGGGIGLGLSICYRIIQDHKATINVESAIGKGTTFFLKFPAI